MDHIHLEESLLLELSDDELYAIGIISTYLSSNPSPLTGHAGDDEDMCTAIGVLNNLHKRIGEIEDLANGDIEYLHSSTSVH
jgi:hypothetical protein